MMRPLRWLLFALAALSGPAWSADAPAVPERPDLVLRGVLDGKDIHTYRGLPFTVPSGTSRITVRFAYDGHDEERTTIDLGLLGPGGFRGRDGFRGWTGSSKQLFTVSVTDATPSFLPGPIEPGRWTLLLGIPNIRPASHARYRAEIWFNRAADPAWEPAVLNPPLRDTAGWYRGDLHMHGAHSDGGCASQSGKHVPCPLFFTVEDAVRRGLDFIALSDHNTLSQLNDMRELQPYFDRVLLIPARELTTFEGHANLFGTTAPVDFRVGSAAVPGWNTLLHQVARLHGLVAINHPIRPNDETCMGCGWTPRDPVDMRAVQAIEAVNGFDALQPDSGVPFWQEQLDKGYRLTAIGGSDNHDALSKLSVGLPSARAGGGIELPDSVPVGTPTTVVHAEALSMRAILEAIRAGHVCIDVQGTRDRVLDLTASAGAQSAQMGDALEAPAGTRVRFTVSTTALAGNTVEIVEDGRVIHPDADLAIRADRQSISFERTGDGKRHWLRANVRGAGGVLLMVGNPIYLNTDSKSPMAHASTRPSPASGMPRTAAPAVSSGGAR